MKNVIEVKNLVKRYKKAKENAVDDISFTVKKGEFFAFLGPNGAGKTTTVSILNTTLSPTSGEVIVTDYDIEKNAAKVRQNIGVIFQNPSLDENLTAEENIRFHTVLYNLYSYKPRYSMMPKSYQTKVQNLTNILGIEKEIFNPIKTFSGGMKRKLEIIRSLMHNPKVLFLDEPTSGLDPASRNSLWKYLDKVRRNEKTTIFLTTHYLEEAEEADHVAIISKGKIVNFGTPNRIKSELIQRFLILDSKNRDDIKREIKRLRLKFIEEKHLKIPLNGKNAQKIISSIKTPLSYLDIHNPTLEEAYLEIIKEENNNIQK